MFDDRRELPIAEDYVSITKNEIMDLEIRKRQIEEEIKLKWERLMGGVSRVDQHKRNIDDEIFILEHGDGESGFWNGEEWTENPEASGLYKEDELPDEFKGCFLDKNDHEDPINWGYHSKDDDDPSYHISRVTNDTGLIRLDRWR